MWFEELKNERNKEKVELLEKRIREELGYKESDTISIDYQVQYFTEGSYIEIWSEDNTTSSREIDDFSLHPYGFNPTKEETKKLLLNFLYIEFMNEEYSPEFNELFSEGKFNEGDSQGMNVYYKEVEYKILHDQNYGSGVFQYDLKEER